MRFPSDEWAEAFRVALNSSAEYREAAAAWEGEILLRVLPPGTDAPAPGIHLALAHGECTRASYHADARSVASEFVYEGSSENWRRLLRGEIDPVKSILDGTFRMRGNLLKASRFTRAAKALVETAAAVPAEVDGSG
ncbi:MAG: SCP2 sterol-binding domain-containing protein [Thermoplasmata archaeon]